MPAAVAAACVVAGVGMQMLDRHVCPEGQEPEEGQGLMSARGRQAPAEQIQLEQEHDKQEQEQPEQQGLVMAERGRKGQARQECIVDTHLRRTC
jgi:hypothetical protein